VSTHEPQHTEELRIMRPAHVFKRVGLSAETIRQLELRDEFPRRVQLALRSTGWIESEIEAWLRERIAKRDEERAQGIERINRQIRGIAASNRQRKPARFGAAA